jgi:putative transposase
MSKIEEANESKTESEAVGDRERRDDSFVNQEITPQEAQRLKYIGELIGMQELEEYRRRRVEVAKALRLSERSVDRLVRQGRRHGVASLIRRGRSDRGSHRVKPEWQEFVVKTYRAGNRGSCRMSRAQVYVRVKVRAQELGCEDCPSRITVYRILQPEIEKAERRRQQRSIGWKGNRLSLKTREGSELLIEWSNQVWQVDHTQVDVLVVDQGGEVLGRPRLTTVVDTYSRCIMGIHLGMEAPSAWVVCLALRHAILPKQYSSAYELEHGWGTYGIPQYLYTDGGKDFRSQHLEQVATQLGIGLHLREQTAAGGIVERPFGTLNQELFSTIPGYTGSNVSQRPKQAEREACLTLLQLERLLVRYLVDRYNQNLDARMGNQSRIRRWDAGRIAQLPLLSERELDICLMRQERRRVYRSGYLQFANLSYQGEHLAGYAGEEVVLRYNPCDITTLLVYQQQGSKDVFLTRAHAVGLETESLSLAEAQAMSRRVRAAGKLVTNQSLLTEVRDRDNTIREIRKQKQKKQVTPSLQSDEVQPLSSQSLLSGKQAQAEFGSDAIERSTIDLADLPKTEVIEVPEVVVHDYEELKRNYGKWW